MALRLLINRSTNANVIFFRCTPPPHLPRSSALLGGVLPNTRSLTSSSTSLEKDVKKDTSPAITTTTANVVLIGAGWWSQGWHLPHLHRNERVNISAIVDSTPHPKSNLNPHLEPLTTLAKRYGCPVYHSLSDLLADPDIGPNMDGAIVCTPHSTHFDIGKELIAEGKRRYEEAMQKQNKGGTSEEEEYRPVNVLMEKPMTTNVREAKELHDLLMYRREVEEQQTAIATATSSTIKNTTAERNNNNNIGGGMGCFLINHSANYRPQARAARALIQSGKIGTIRHVSAFFASPLSWIFDDPSNIGWNEPDDSGEMLGNGFAWGQSSHLLAWIYHVTSIVGTTTSSSSSSGSEHDEQKQQLAPSRVFCAMTTSEKTGADVSHAATVICKNGATFSLSGTSLLPGNAHSDPPVAKRIKIKIFGTKGALFFSGNDRDPSSGKLEWLRGDDDDDDSHENVGAVEIQCPELGFEFEDLDQDGIGPESLQCFIHACLRRDDYYVGADSLVGLRSVQTVDAMYRSHVSGNCENVKG